MTKRFCDKCGAEASGVVLLVRWIDRLLLTRSVTDGYEQPEMNAIDLCQKCADAIKEALPG